MYTVLAYDPNDPQREKELVGKRELVPLADALSWAREMEGYGYRAELFEELPHGRQAVWGWRK